MAFLLDDILLAPVKGIRFIARQIHEQAMGELLDKEGVRQELRELYMGLETGRITEEEFQEREKTLVERLEQIQAYEEAKAG